MPVAFNNFFLVLIWLRAEILSIPDADQLFDMALGAYDFDLVLFVAERSQKDPKEFLPFLNELKGYPDHYRKYKIDRHLKRNESALTHIVAQCLAGTVTIRCF